MEYRKSTNYTIEEFKEIIEILRSDHGCPWDRVQTHESLKPCMMEEAAEVLAGIRILDKTGNGENLKEELGDVLLQVVMHSQIAKEEGLFSFEDVVDDVSRKMIRRHPHVFVQDGIKADTVDQVLTNWEDIKKQEKKGKEWAKQPLHEIPMEFPSLLRGTKVAKKLTKLYPPQPVFNETVSDFDFLADEIAGIIEQMQENESMDEQQLKEQLEHCMKELLWQICVISAKFGISLEQLLMNKIENMIENYES